MTVLSWPCVFRIHFNTDFPSVFPSNWMKQFRMVNGASSYSLVTKAVADFTAVASTKGSKVDSVQGTVRQTKHCNVNAGTLFAHGAEERCMQGFDRET